MKPRLLYIVFLIIATCYNVCGQYYNTFPKYLNANKNIGVYGGSYYFTVNAPSEIQFHNNPRGTDGMVTVTNFMVSDPNTGELLFYSESRKIDETYSITKLYNKHHDTVQNGVFAFTNSITEMMHFTSVVPFIEDDYKFYLFYYKNIDEFGEKFNLCYAILDMRANGGLGAVEVKDVVLRSGLIKQFQRGVIPANNCNMWVLFFDDFDDRLYSYELRNTGLDTVPVETIMNVNSTLEQANNPVFKISPDRQTLFMSTTITDRTSADATKGVFVQDLFFWKFDLETGKANNSMRVSTNFRTSEDPFANYEFIDHTTILMSLNSTYGNGKNSEYLIDFKEYNEQYIQRNIKQLKNEHTQKGLFVEYKKFDNHIYKLNPATSSFNIGNMNWDYQYGQLHQSSFDGILNDKVPLQLPIDERTFLPNFILREPNYSNNFFSYEVVYPLPEGYEFTNSVSQITHCFNNEPTRALNVPRESTKYIWDDGSTSRERIISQPGVYWVKYDHQCIKLVDSFYVKDAFDGIDIYNIDTVVCSQHFPVMLRLNNQVDSILIGNAFYQDKIKVDAPFTHLVELYNEGCVKESKIEVKDEICACELFKPNAFTPNGDGLNDYFKPVIASGCIPIDLIFKVYDRYGQTVYISYNANDKGWDGTLRGKSLNSDVYYYTFEFKDRFTGKQFYYQGDVTLLR